MAGGTLLHILLLCVFCSCCAQIFNNPNRERMRLSPRDRRRFEYMDLDMYFDLHDRRNPKDHTSLEPRFILLAPNILRTDSEESIYLESHGLNSPVTVTITVHDYPERRYQLLQDTVTLGPANSYHTLQIIKLPSKRLVKGNEESSRNQYVYVKAEFGGYHEAEQVVMVSFHSGYIFIQTDKPLYKPGDTVRCRAFVSTPTFQAINSSITIEFQNSDGVVVKQTSRTIAKNGIFADTHVLPDIVNEGTWKIIAKFDNWQQNKFSSEFEVKKYVLPAFNVTLTPKKPFLRLDDTELVVEITARYLYGEDVQGTAYVMFGVEVNKEKRRLPLIKQVTNLQQGTATLTMAEIRKAYPDLSSLVGSSIYVKASVLTKSGSDLVEAEKSGIKIVKSPYVLSFIETPKYYKPGLPFDIMIQVSFQDGSPAHNVPVQVSLLANPITSHRGTIRTAINMPAELGPQIITAETKQTGLQPEQQARQQMTLHPYTPFDQQRQNYLYISTGTTTVSLGQSLGLSLHINTADKAHRELITHLTYLVLNKGKIIVAKRLEVGGQDMTNILLTVTKEMMPSFRVVAFYMLPWAGTSEVVADSVWVDVEDACVGALSVGPAGSRPSEYYHPGRGFNFQVRGDPGAMVSLVVVDNAVFLLNRQRLTQRKIWQVVEGGDIGCTHGGGSNSMGVFTDAGLLFYSNTGGATSSRQGMQCPGRSRRRRSAEMLQRRTLLENHYREKLLRQCCKDGLREIPMPYSCTRRSLYITEGWECIKAFRYCCSKYRGEEFDTRLPPTTTIPPTTTDLLRLTLDRHIFPEMRETIEFVEQSEEILSESLVRMESKPVLEVQRGSFAEEEEEEEEDDFMEESEVTVRSKFYESWLWKDLPLPSVPEDSRDGLATLHVESIFPDTITQWGVLAISSSPVTGFCVAEPWNVRAWKRFFVDLKLPYSVARNEHVEIKAVLHNYGDEDLEVKVVLLKTEDMCSVAFNGKHTQEVRLKGSSSLVVPYTIIPLKAGEMLLEVLAMAKGFMGSDGVNKKLRVVVEGVQKTKVQSFVLNPSVKGGNDGRQVVEVDKVELGSLVPNSQPETFINIRGNLLADTIDNSISGDSLASLIRMPGGCVEQNLASITLPLIATVYLDHSNDWEAVGVQRRVEAMNYIQKGYQKQLVYKKKDDSYPPYRNEGTSTWITAYVVKVFSMARQLVGVSEQDVCGPLLYLINNKQQTTGSFREDNPVYTTTMTGGVQGAESQSTLTAFVLIAMTEATKGTELNCNGAGHTIKNGIQNAANYLRSTYGSLKRPYSLAISAYALSLVDETPSLFFKTLLLKAASPDGTHWPDSENRLFTLEATGYALLALVKSHHMTEAAAPFEWLNEQRRRGGGYGSTQPTMVVLQGLSGYLMKKPPNDLSLQVDLSIQGRSDQRYHFDPRTSYVARSSRAPIDQGFRVEAKGKGQGILEVVTYYNELPEMHEKSSCKNFDLDVTIAESSEKPPPDAEKSYRITINVRALGLREVRMVVLDISLPTGFVPENEDLEMLTNSVDRYINNFQIVDNLSDRGSLIIHLFKVSNKETETIIFRLQQTFKVGLLQPSSVTVYEYYNPDHRCSRFYSPKEDKDELSQICRNNICRCTQGDCCVSKSLTDPVPYGAREDHACKGLYHVYKAKVLSVSQSQYDRYEMKITQVIKIGVEEGVSVGDTKVFLSHAGCRGGLDLKEGTDYLIMGPKTDLWYKDSSTNSATYMLGKDAWVERWPTSTECASDAKLKARCTELDNFSKDLSEKGCRFK
ncbi:venom factor isoform X1 [Oncorhynchus mykiss]|uniref:Complement C3-like n=1 Tax=Oncorhynchus mykiss TaxID=8022 RepID=A0A8K9Y6I4_ONCMY|nr:venom factor isoform X1 [Oncorhynchus mykiss]XP_036805106.1 venom factor isoform X1 [Oncorhynchus mykiss]